MMDQEFTIVGIRPELVTEEQKNSPSRKKRWPQFISAAVLGLILLGCFGCDLFLSKDPSYMDLLNCSRAPSREFLFGTDSLGRDIFSMVWYGGRVSLLIGFLSTLISTLVAIVYGSLSGMAPDWLDTLMMRFTEIFLSVPGLLLVIFLQAILGEANVLSISIVIGMTSWPSIAKVVRTEVRQLRASEYILASRSMGGGFFHILFRHLAPNFFPSILFMVIMNIRSAIVSESTLSFMGIGLPLEIISWGSMLSLSEKALLTRSWWILVIPGLFLIVTLMCVTSVGNYFRKSVSRKDSNL